MKHIISVAVENKSGVLSRISGLFSSRGFNIDNLTVGEMEDPSMSRMTMVVNGDDDIIEQVCKQLNKLIDVVKVIDLSTEGYIERELILVRVNSSAEKRSQLLELIEIFKANIVEVTQKTITIEFSGSEDKVDSLLDLLSSYGIKEMVRTGMVALGKSK